MHRPFPVNAKLIRERIGDGGALDTVSRDDFTMINEWSARFDVPPSATSFPVKCAGCLWFCASAKIVD